MSRSSLKRAECKLDFVQDKISLLGEQVTLMISRSGHYCVPLQCDKNSNTRVKHIMFSSPLNDDNSVEKKILKLHKQFAHPSSERLLKIVKDSGITDKNIHEVIKDVSQKCDVCKRFKKPPNKPIVSFPLASDFNQTVAMDLKVIDKHLVLHSQACLVKNKKAETIVHAVMTHWIQIFGAPESFLTDNGGEFVNSSLLELAETMNITLKTTAAESA